METINGSAFNQLIQRGQRKDYRGGRTKQYPARTRPFVAWDGEGWTDDDGDHHYMLFGNSLGDVEQDRSLSYRRCFECLLNRSGDGIHVVYGGTYDVIMMTKAMPVRILERLRKGKVTTFGGYRMLWYPHKMFRVSDGKRAVTLYDVMTFFSCSFVKACRQYLGDDDVLREMEAMKQERSSFQLDDPRIVPYWQSELDYLVRLLTRLRELLAEVGVHPIGWHGPGAVASSLLKSHNMHQYYDEQPEEIIELAERCYYGGRFEQFKVGHLSALHEYDIRSAYPAGIQQLPSFRNCSWSRSTGPFRQINRFGLYRVSWSIPRVGATLHRPGPLPWRRDDGRIFYPHSGVSSWFWGIEVLNLTGFPADQWEIHEAWLPEFASEAQPFDWVGEMYDRRAAMKRDGNPAQLALKLGLNSLYGKLAQSKGARQLKDGSWKKPSWHHILWAGWITANTRREMFKAMIHNAPFIVATETDATFAMKECNVNIGEGLGEWEHQAFDDTLYIQSGVYFVSQNGEWQFKSRGINQERMPSVEDWQAMFAELPHNIVEATHRGYRFGTIPGRSNYGRWYEHKATITLPNLNAKRIHVPHECPTCTRFHRTFADGPHFLVVPEPALFNNVVPSTPYALPWRKDIAYEWPDELVETIEDVPRLEWQ